MKKGWIIFFVYTNDRINIDDIDAECAVPRRPLVAFELENNKLKTAKHLEPGKAYLVRISKPCNIPFTQEPIKLDSIELKEGWNAKGTTKLLNVGDIKQKCGEGTKIFDLSEGRLILLKDEDELYPNNGYLFGVREDCNIKL